MRLNVVNLPIDKIIPYENNPRINDKGVDAVAESIRQFGFKVPVIVDCNHVIIAGHTRIKAAKLLGLLEVPCIIANDLSEEQARALRIADNRTSDFSIWDNRLLLQELDAISDELFTGFELGEIFDVDVLDEKNSNIANIGNAIDASLYEVVFRSESKDKIEAIKSAWEAMQNE